MVVRKVVTVYVLWMLRNVKFVVDAATEAPHGWAWQGNASSPHCRSLVPCLVLFASDPAMTNARALFVNTAYNFSRTKPFDLLSTTKPVCPDTQSRR